MAMSQRNSHASEVLRRFIQQAESYNRCMFKKAVLDDQRSTDRITAQILFCQNQMEHLTISTNKPHLIDKTASKTAPETLMVDIVSNQYPYARSSFDLNVIQQCSVVSITSPHAFTIQLTKDLAEFEQFCKSMNDYYNSIDDLHIPKEHLRPHLLCLTWDDTSSSWNRSQILEYDLLDDTVNVFFVDLNSWEEHVARSRIRFILTKYSSQPVGVFTCRLASITSLGDAQWPEMVLKTFQNVIQDCRCDVEPLYQGRDQTFSVNLFAAHQEAYVCVNDFLIHCQMAKPFDDISSEANSVYLKDANGGVMHPMLALYWKAGEAMLGKETNTKKAIAPDPHSPGSIDSFESKSSGEHLPLTKSIQINEEDKIIFARYKNYIMLPWFTVSHILKELQEEKLRQLATRFGFKPVVIDALTHPILCSQLVQSLSPAKPPSEIHLYSIDCVRKILQLYHHPRTDIEQLLDRARLAEAKNDVTFWQSSFE